MRRFNLARLFLAALVAATILAGTSRAEIQDGLVSYWPLDGNFIDYAGFNDGVMRGSDLTRTFDGGISKVGIDLDGVDQFVEIMGDESQFDFVDQDFSISAWFRVDAFEKSWQALIAKGEGNRWRVHRRGDESILTWNGGNADVPADSNFPIDDGALHHFVGVSTADEVLMYMDGELVSVGPPPAVENNAQPVMIGENPDARGRTWNGLVDEVGIWGRALDESEIEALYNSGDGLALFDTDGPIPPLPIGGRGTIGSNVYGGVRSNEMYGEQQLTAGFTGRIVTFADHGQTIDNHTIAEEVLDDFEGTTAIGAYDVVDLAGGGGTFSVNHPYPNDVNNDSQNDFAVRVTADVVIPAGTWTIAFGSDDGGQVTLEGVEFLDYLNSDSIQDDQIRFEGNRGHDWTVGVFELDEPLATTLVGSFHERGGGDSFEIAVIDTEALEAANPANGWELLGDGVFGWEVNTMAAPLVSADWSGTAVSERPLEFDVNGDTGEVDQLVIDNPDPDVFTTILDVDGLSFHINATGAVASGNAYTIVNADQIVGSVTITSEDPTQNWVWDGLTGRICLDTCPPAVGAGDYNGNGVLDAADLDLQATEIGGTNPAYDLNGDGQVTYDDRLVWVRDLKGTWIGDANLDGEFNSSDFVQVFTFGKFETNEAATWDQGDWNGDQVFSSSDFVVAFQDGGYENGPRAAVSAVPEPSSLVLTLASLVSLFGLARRRNG